MPRTTHLRVGPACGVGGGFLACLKDLTRTVPPCRLHPELHQEILHFHAETARRWVAATNITLSRGGGEQKQAV